MTDTDRLLVCVSDTHNQHKGILIPNCWALVHCGDFTMNGTRQEFDNFLTWFCRQPAKHKIFISGNHDWICQNEEDYVLSEAKAHGIHYLRDSEIVLDGIKFYGSPWQPWYGGWAWNFKGSIEQGDRRAYEIQALEVWEKIPLDIDVLLTHGPPHGIQDLVPPRYERGGPRDLHVGCKYMRDRVLHVKPLVHVFGHIHNSYGETTIPGWRTLFANASQLGEDYRSPNPPITYQLDSLFDLSSRQDLTALLAQDGFRD